MDLFFKLYVYKWIYGNKDGQYTLRKNEHTDSITNSFAAAIDDLDIYYEGAFAIYYEITVADNNSVNSYEATIQ
ncbi:MAG: hypothetical protein GXZ11_02815 [Tissierellia bacterium]|nr:hypothetical protein [Tissierellia bacterium]